MQGLVEPGKSPCERDVVTVVIRVIDALSDMNVCAAHIGRGGLNLRREALQRKGSRHFIPIRGFPMHTTFCDVISEVARHPSPRKMYT